MLAQHHEEHIGEDKSREEDDHSLMATSSSHTEMGNRTGGEGEEEEPQQDPLTDFCWNSLGKQRTS